MEMNLSTNFFVQLDELNPNLWNEFEAHCERQSFAAGEIIFEQGSESTAVYIIASGVVEAFTISPDRQQTRSIAYMERGNFFGDLGVLTDRPRLASIRACEPSHVFKIGSSHFLRLLEKSNELTTYFTRSIARRLYNSSLESHRALYAADLCGNLRSFDLLSMFQAITGMRSTGELSLHDSAHNLLGSFYFQDGQVTHARYFHLQGIEAVWQGFIQSCSEGTFSFQVMPLPAIPAQAGNEIQLGRDELLMQGATRRDSYQALPELLRAMEGRLRRLTPELQWADPDTQACAVSIWNFLAKRSQPLTSMWRRLNYSNLTFLQVVEGLLAQDQAELVEDNGAYATTSLPTPPPLPPAQEMTESPQASRPLPLN